MASYTVNINVKDENGNNKSGAGCVIRNVSKSVESALLVSDGSGNISYDLATIGWSANDKIIINAFYKNTGDGDLFSCTSSPYNTTLYLTYCPPVLIPARIMELTTVNESATDVCDVYVYDRSSATVLLKIRTSPNTSQLYKSKVGLSVSAGHCITRVNTSGTKVSTCSVSCNVK